MSAIIFKNLLNGLNYMEERERIIELLLGLIFISILLLAVLFVLTSQPVGASTTTISNSYNTNSYNTNTYSPDKVSDTNTLYVVNRNNVPVYKDFYYVENSYKKDQYLKYYSYGKHTKEKDFIGGYVDKFNVYVRNVDKKSGYFKVKFYFEDYDGKKTTEIVTKYIRAGEKETFTDVQFEKYKYHDWRYEVFPDKTSSKVYFDYVYY